MPESPGDTAQDFARFMREREGAARAYVRGEPALLRHLAARTPPVTFFGPQGGILQGADAVLSRYENDATAFQGGGETNFEVLHLAAGETLGYWVGIQRASARLGGRTVPMELRITELFRREEGGWKLIHRHADPLVAETAPKKKRAPGRRPKQTG